MNDLPITGLHLLTLLPPLLLIQGFFSGSEIAILSADKIKLTALAKKGSGGAKRALEMADRPERLLATTLVMTSLCVIATTVLISFYFMGTHPERESLYSVLLASPLIVLFGELFPKTLYRRYSERLAPITVHLIIGTFYALYPITRFLSQYTNRITRMIRPFEHLLTGKKRTTRDELKSILPYGKNSSALRPAERRMIKRIFDFRDTDAKHALIPLVKVEAVEKNQTIASAIRLFQKHRHSRMPVFDRRVDNIVGIIEVAQLVGVKDPQITVERLMRPAHYAAVTQTLEDLIQDMHRTKTEMSIVVNEHGGAVGILTFEDIFEEIVGEINDEYDANTALYRIVDDHTWTLDAAMEIPQVNEILKFGLPEGDYETVGGFLLQEFGRIPESRDELHVSTTQGSFRFIIRDATERKIISILVERIHESEN